MAGLFFGIGGKGALGAVLLAGGSLAFAAPASAQVALGLTISAGGGTVSSTTPCPDIPCNTGDKCSCVTSSGYSIVATTGGTDTGSYTLEVSADNSARSNNGAGGTCYPSTAILNFKLGMGNIDMRFGGLGCRLGSNQSRAPLAISAPAVIHSSTGYYSNALGLGTMNASFSPNHGGVVLLDGIFAAVPASPPATK